LGSADSPIRIPSQKNVQSLQFEVFHDNMPDEQPERLDPQASEAQFGVGVGRPVLQAEIVDFEEGAFHQIVPAEQQGTRCSREFRIPVEQGLIDELLNSAKAKGTGTQAEMDSQE
jgi:hypothetical protein